MAAQTLVIQGEPDTGIALLGDWVGDGPARELILSRLRLTGATQLALSEPIAVAEADGFLAPLPAPRDASHLRLIQVQGDVLAAGADLELDVAVGTSVEIFGVTIKAGTRFALSLFLFVPEDGEPSEQFVRIEACLLPIVGNEQFETELCFGVLLRQLWVDGSSEPMPVLFIALPDIGVPVPLLPLPWSDVLTLSIGLPEISWPAYSINLSGIDLTLSWDRLRLILSKTRQVLQFDGFKVEGFGGRLDMIVKLAIEDGRLDISQSSIRIEGVDYQPTDWSFDGGCFLLAWQGNNLSSLVHVLAPGFDADLGADARIAVMLLSGEDGIEEIRIECEPGAQALTFNLPGFDIEVPNNARLGLAYISANRGVDPPGSDTLVASLVLPSGAETVARSTFTWTRGAERELLGPKNDRADPEPFLSLAAKPNAELGLVLFELPSAGDIRALRQMPTPPARIETGSCEPTSFPNGRLDKDQWTLRACLSKDFQLPFLDGDNQGVEQLVRVKDIEIAGTGSNPNDPRVCATLGQDMFEQARVGVGLTLEVLLGPLKLNSPLALSFDWERMAFDVDHDAGLELILASDVKGDLFGLRWVFRKREDGKPFFRLQTADGDYRLLQLKGSEIELIFDRATTPDQPIVFIVSDLELSAGGVSLRAEVSPRPARLNGFETEFGFTSGSLVIRDNHIIGFGIQGEGTLPPDLIGDVKVKAELYFEQRGKNLQLESGGIEFSGELISYSSGTGFEFSLEGIALEFEEMERRYNFYCLITASAEFKPQTGAGDGLLGWLPGVKIKLVECPLTGNMRVISSKVRFLVDLPEPTEFDVFGAFKMEIRGFGFLPQCDKFSGDGALAISGQIFFGDGGDSVSGKFDFHNLYLGLPEHGSLLPRVWLRGLGMEVNFADTAKIAASVELVDRRHNPIEGVDGDGFLGGGSIKVEGFPPMSVTAGFITVRRDDDSRVKAGFFYIKASEISLKIPVVEVFLREVGAGIGVRYTLAGIEVADRTNDTRLLIKELKELSRTQANLDNARNWSPDIEAPGQSPRVTMALSGVFSATSATTEPLEWKAKEEAQLPCPYLFDSVVALRSDLTFFMVARAWLNTNYYDFHAGPQRSKIRTSPLASGFVLLSPRQNRLLAHVASNPNAAFGGHPPTPEFLQRMIKEVRFSATLLVEPGLVHMELGWPNVLRWTQKPTSALSVVCRGGMITRTTRDELVTGVSFQASGQLRFSASVSAGFVGADLSATADVGYGARYIGVLDYHRIERSALYATVGVDVRIRVSVRIWLKIKIGSRRFGCRCTKRWNIDFQIGFTAALELGVVGMNTGFRGTGTFCLHTRWKTLRLSASIAGNPGPVDQAKRITARYLNIGLESDEVEPIPGTTKSLAPPGPAPALVQPAAALPGNAALIAPGVGANAAETSALAGGHEPTNGAERLARGRADPSPTPVVSPAAKAAMAKAKAQMAPALGASFVAPDYVLMSKAAEHSMYLLMLPRDARVVGTDGRVQEGFFAVPPAEQPVGAANSPNSDSSDYVWTLPVLPTGLVLERFIPADPSNPAQPSGWIECTFDQQRVTRWRMPWDSVFERVEFEEEENALPSAVAVVTIRHMLRLCYIAAAPSGGQGSASDPGEALRQMVPLRDPRVWPENDEVRRDDRLNSPDAFSVEAAVRGADEQFRASPYLKQDQRRSQYCRDLAEALNPDTEIYSPEPIAQPGRADNEAALDESDPDKQADQLRSTLLMQMTTDLRQRSDEIDATPNAAGETVGGALGMLFRVRRSDHSQPLTESDREALETRADWGKVRQRIDPVSADRSDEHQVTLYNTRRTSFEHNPPRLNEIHRFEEENCIALGWNLTWSRGLGDDDPVPEDMLAYYLVRRQREGDVDSAVEYQVRNLDPLAPEVDDRGVRLRRVCSRFQIIDHFEPDFPVDLETRIPYQYTVTPIAIDGTPGRTRPITAYRRLRTPPPPPLEPRLECMFPVDDALFEPNTATPHQPMRLAIRWRPDLQAEQGTGVARLRLIFRRRQMIPAGFYGLNADARGGRNDGLPTSAARALRTDRIVSFSVIGEGVKEHEDEQGLVRYLLTPEGKTDLLSELRAIKVLPGNGHWQPAAWDLFLQSESLRGTRSALIPVRISLQFARKELLEDLDLPLSLNPERLERVEARDVGWLEWPTRPVTRGSLTTEDMDPVDSGRARVPLPTDQSLGLAQRLVFAYHPDGVRAHRLGFNQTPSVADAVAPTLGAGFRILRFDAASNPGHLLEVHDDDMTWGEYMTRAHLTEVERMELAPADDLALHPRDTSATRNWEAWYPSRLARQPRHGTPAIGREPELRNWYSWRESELLWPASMADTPLALYRHPFPNSTGVIRLRGRHALLDEILVHMEHRLLGQAFEGDATLSAQRAGEIARALDHGSADTGELGDLLQALRQNPDDANGAIIGSSVPGRRWQLLRADGVRLRIERVASHRPEKLWRILDDDAPEGTLLERITVPFERAAELGTLLRDTDVGSDPYGWGILQRMGLSVCFAMRLPDTDRYLPASQVLERLEDAIDAALDDIRFTHLHDPQPGLNRDLRRHLFAELLVRPDKRLEIDEEADFEPDERLLAMVQLSLRPIPRPVRVYQTWTLKAKSVARADRPVRVVVEVTAVNTENGKDCDYLSDPATPGAVEIVNKDTKLTLSLAAGGELPLHFRGIPQSDGMTLLDLDLSVEHRDDFELTGPVTSAPTDATSALFDWPAGIAGDEWGARMGSDFPGYLQLLGAGGNLDEISDESFKISDPATKRRVLEWLTRFFDHGPEDPAATPTPCWSASAYPTAVAPSLVTPDANGEIRLDRTVDSRWALMERYLVVPVARYDRLWQTLAGSEALTAHLKRKEAVELRAARLRKLDRMAGPPRGGGDAVLPRVRAVTSPVVLGTSRLDLFSVDGRPAPPGRTWEVIIARHTEERLVERNASLQARLDFDDQYWYPQRSFAFRGEFEGLRDLYRCRYRMLQERRDDFVEPAATPKVVLTVAGVSSSKDLDAEPSQFEQIEGFLRAMLPANAVVSSATLSLGDPIVGANAKEALIVSATMDLDLMLVDGNGNQLLEKLSVPRLPSDLESQWQVQLLDDRIELPQFPRTDLDAEADERLREQGWLSTDAPSPEQLRMLDLPLRLHNGNDANVYQFDALPYYYRVRLWLVACAGIVHSEPSQVVQEAFHYLSPIPQLQVDGELHNGIRARRLTLALARHWDCLEQATKDRWPGESPPMAHHPGDGLGYGALPDTAVRYQLLLARPGGIIELIAEAGFEAAQRHGFAVRSISDGFHVEATDIAPPDDKGRVQLQMKLTRVSGSSSGTVQQSIGSRHLIPAAAVPEVCEIRPLNATRLALAGVLDPAAEQELRSWLANESDPKDESLRSALQLLLTQQDTCIETVRFEDDSGFRCAFDESSRVSERLQLLNALGLSMRLMAKIEKRSPDLYLVHDGERVHHCAFQPLGEGRDVVTLSWVVRDNVALAGVGLEQLAELPALRGQFQLDPVFEDDRGNGPEPFLRWRGGMGDAQLAVLDREEHLGGETVRRGWAHASDYRAALNRLIDALRNKELFESFNFTAPPIPAELSPRLAVKTDAGGVQGLSWGDLVLVPETEKLLKTLSNLASASAGQHAEFSAALERLLIRLVGDQRGQRELLSVPVDNPQWRPRPSYATIAAKYPNLAKVLSLRLAQIETAKVLTRAEAGALADAVRGSAPDLRACSELYHGSVNAGLDGTRLEIRSLRGSAVPQRRAADAIIPEPDPAAGVNSPGGQ